MSKDLAFRLHGARLAAGMLTLVEAALGLAITKSTYARFESGYSRVGEQYYDRISRLFGVSQDFLQRGLATSPKEVLSARLAAIAAAVEGGELDFVSGAPGRIRRMRDEANYRSASAAAADQGWAPATYIAHESGESNVTLDRLIGYALGYGFRPEFAVGLPGPLNPSQEERTDWWQMASKSASAEPSQFGHVISWRWLSKTRDTARLTFPVVHFAEGRFDLLDREPLAIPRGLLNDRASSVSGPVYGVFSHAESRVFIIDPASNDGLLVNAHGNGDI
jgi:hypothetical protein